MEIKMDCKILLITLFEKLLEKAPVRHQLVRNPSELRGSLLTMSGLLGA